MDARPSALPLAILATLIAIVVACSRPTTSRASADTVRQASLAANAVSARPADDVRAVCDSTAAQWRLVSNAKVTTSDTMIAPWTDDSPDAIVAACEVVARVDSVRDTIQIAETYWSVARWAELWKWHGDGPDGQSSVFHRATTRCAVHESWDGGDDEDTTVVPSPFRAETTLCWHSRPLVAGDTAQMRDGVQVPPSGGVAGAIVRVPPAKRPPD